VKPGSSGIDESAVAFVYEHLLAPVEFHGETRELRISGSRKCLDEYPGYSGG
jgi:hypothetical protein